MDKLIITATVDAGVSFPRCPYYPKSLEEIAEEYRGCVDAGAGILHLHGVYHTDEKVQADGTKMADLDIPAWGNLRQLIDEKCPSKPIIQYGIANGRFNQRLELMEQKPDMVSVCFNHHDECFKPYADGDAVEIFGLHPREELRKYAVVCRERGIKVEVESFHMGAVWNAKLLHDEGLLDEPLWTTLFFGWQGGTWQPPTPKSLINMVDHLPAYFNFNVSVMDPPTQWQMLTTSIILGGHVRVGMEDNPYVSSLGGELLFATSNAELVEKIARISKELGREVATPSEARKIAGIGE